MPASVNTSRESEKFNLRLPDGMRDQLKKAAAENGRSINSEIVHRLSVSLNVDTWDDVELSTDEKNSVEQLMNFLDRAREHAARLAKKPK